MNNGEVRSSRRGLAPLPRPVRTPFPIVEQLPGMLQDDPMTREFTAGLDDVWASALVALDNLHAYLDPRTAPADFLIWLASWVGVALDENWPEHRQRALVSRAVELYHWRGTAKGIRALVALYTGIEPEIADSGGVRWSLAPGEPAPGQARPKVAIRLRAAEPDRIDTARLRVLVADAVPAHVPFTIEVVAAP
ncbi:MAG TPA: phage tail protein [Euzebyales bacterium]|jgi:phage tail-like protein|nr:phage tail protein [Euzebyales bacterium]